MPKGSVFYIPLLAFVELTPFFLSLLGYDRARWPTVFLFSFFKEALRIGEQSHILTETDILRAKQKALA